MASTNAVSRLVAALRRMIAAPWFIKTLRISAFVTTLALCAWGAWQGLLLGVFLSKWLPTSITIFGKKLALAVTGVSAVVFIALVEKAIPLIHSICSQLSKVDLKDALFDGLKTTTAFAAFALTLGLIPAATDVAAPMPTLLAIQDRYPKAILPVLFAKNAKLKAERENEPNIASSSSEIWSEGALVKDIGAAEIAVIQGLLERVMQCSGNNATKEDPVVLEVWGFASSREFTDSRNGTTRADSDDLNLRAAFDRATATYSVLTNAAKEFQQTISIRSVPRYENLAQMAKARVYLDRVMGRSIVEDEALSRRAEIRVVDAPGCEALTAAIGR